MKEMNNKIQFLMMSVIMFFLMFLIFFSICESKPPILDDGVHYLDDPIEQQMIDFMDSMKMHD